MEIIAKTLGKFKDYETKCTKENRPDQAQRFKHYVEGVQIVLDNIELKSK